jgi:polyisoprenoid-binding protein YceI
MRVIVALLAGALPLLALPGPVRPAAAEPVRYALEAERSEVGFEVAFGPDKITGTMPVAAADITLDFEQAANSRVSVRVDASGAQASFPFATQAMRGPKVLATGSFPSIAFVSREVRARGDGAQVRGDITIRGVTRPVTLQATLYRQREAPQDSSRLSILLTGAVRRSDFGADGWGDMVGDEVALRILARIARAE